MTPESLQVCLRHHHWYLEQIVHPWSNWPWLTSLKSDFEPRCVYAWFSEPGVLHKPWTSWTTDHECQLRNEWARCNSKVTIPQFRSIGSFVVRTCWTFRTKRIVNPKSFGQCTEYPNLVIEKLAKWCCSVILRHAWSDQACFCRHWDLVLIGHHCPIAHNLHT